MFDSLGPHGLQHARLPCPSPSPRVCSKSGSLRRWCHPTISKGWSCWQDEGVCRVSGGGSPDLDEFSGPFNLVSCGFVAASPLIAIVQICSLELREGHVDGSLAYKKWGTKRAPCLGAPQGPARFQQAPMFGSPWSFSLSDLSSLSLQQFISYSSRFPTRELVPVEDSIFGFLLSTLWFCVFSNFRGSFLLCGLTSLMGLRTVVDFSVFLLVKKTFSLVTVEW